MKPIPFLIFTAIAAAPAHAAFVIAGSFQSWDPPTGPVMTDLGGGIFEHTITGLTNGTQYQFKILEDTDSNPQWGDTEITPLNNWFTGDSDGNVTIRLTTNPGDGFDPATNRVGILSTAWIPQLVGDFQVAAGGAANWNPTDSFFNMTDAGGGIFTFTASISTPGTYAYKATDGTGWDRQFGADGYNNNAANLSFTTTTAGETIQFTANTGNGYLTATTIPEPSAALLGAFGTLALLRRRK